MSDNIDLNAPTSIGKTVATKQDSGGAQHELVMVEYADVSGEPVKVSAANPLPVAATISTAGLATSAKQDTQITAEQAILAKIIAAPATEAKQDTEISGLASILAKIIAAPATEAKQDTGNTSLSTIAGKDFATQTTLAALLAKVIAAPSTEAKQDVGNTSLASIDSKLSNPTKMLLSGSTNGKGIKVVQIATAGTLIHTAVSGTSSLDKVWIYAYNSHTADVVLTMEWGEATVPDGNTIITIPFKQGRLLIEDGRLLQNGLVVRAFASVANVIIIDGEVDRYT